MKRFIYIMKIQSRRPTFTIFLNYLSERIQSESLISLTKNKYNTRSDIFNNLIWSKTNNLRSTYYYIFVLPKIQIMLWFHNRKSTIDMYQNFVLF